MNEDLEVSEGSSSMIGTAIALLALVLGGAGLYFGLTANQRLTPLSETLEAGATGTAELEKTIDSLRTELAELGEQFNQLQSSTKRQAAYANQRDQAIKKLASEINVNREQIIQTAENLNGLAAGAVRSTSAPSESAAANDQSSEPSVGGVYVIESGDTFAKIAAKTGVGLQALLDANPNADPRRLAIGQSIQIPAN